MWIYKNGANLSIWVHLKDVITSLVDHKKSAWKIIFIKISWKKFFSLLQLALPPVRVDICCLRGYSYWNASSKYFYFKTWILNLSCYTESSTNFRTPIFFYYSLATSLFTVARRQFQIRLIMRIFCLQHEF